ncbi:hypothetical protein D5R95_08750 [Methanosalsum natronophilum]|uniref:Uncharacterized protein n=1 Tax=Methanosalsum natronophilum TaxID=768733 RepID=A0A424YNR0_9EURY|nr:MAG: hypothetical protein D5R95_08750 [Methanosalsum natronophilum]
MRLEQEDKEAIINIVAARYFSCQDWTWINLKNDIEKIYSAYEELNQQYIEYPYMSRDWYVANSVTKNIHMCSTWDELKNFVDFLKAYGNQFNFLVKAEKKSLCITTENDQISPDYKIAISEARKMGYNVFVFTARVPERIDFDLSYISGGI